MEIRQRFALEMSSIRRQTLKLGASVEQALQKALRALLEQDHPLADSVVRDDCRVGAMCAVIQSLCTKAIATHQPVARDLRELIATMQVAAELDRIGDHARHLAEGVEVVADPHLRLRMDSLEKMATMGIVMLKDALEAYTEMDVEAATGVIGADDALDNLYWSAHRDLMALMQSKPSTVERGTSLMFLNRFLERLGDHTTAICQWIIFAQTGRHSSARETSEGAAAHVERDGTGS